jgi:hypothetical protein
MKTIQFFAVGILLFFASTAHSQVSVSINLGSPPPWGPVGYTDVRYYYLPDVQAYYDVQSSMFIYYGGGRWIHRSYLPGRYRNYDLYGGYKVVMSDYHGDTPYTHFREHKVKYGRGYHGEAQRTIGERPGRGNPGPGVSHDRGPGRQGVGHSKGNYQKKEQGRGGNKGRKK